MTRPCAHVGVRARVVIPRWLRPKEILHIDRKLTVKSQCARQILGGYGFDGRVLSRVARSLLHLSVWRWLETLNRRP